MISLKKLFKQWGVVQPAERVAVNHEVAGSSPAAPAKEKEKSMSTNNTKELKTQITSLRLRINELVEEMYSLKNEVKRFKEDVANDVKYLTERVDN
tara:strand:+ start:511 stop:798 length:288 start_codon:yes stop_codon:yes gene_type:complete